MHSDIHALALACLRVVIWLRSHVGAVATDESELPPRLAGGGFRPIAARRPFGLAGIHRMDRIWNLEDCPVNFRHCAGQRQVKDSFGADQNFSILWAQNQRSRLN